MKTRSLKRSLILALSAIFLTIMGPANASALDPSLSCATLPIISKGMMSTHVSGKREDDVFAKRLASIWAERLDPTESLLTQSEYEALEKRLYIMAKDVRAGRCADFKKLKTDQIAWHTNMETFVRKTVSAKKFKVDKKRVFDLDPEKRKRPENAKKQTKLRRALIDFQMANYLANGTKKDEAKEKLIHRYELVTKRISDQKDSDLYGAYLNAFASALDPHTTYFSAEDLEDFQISMRLSLEGIGARLSSRDGYTTIEDIVPGGAADREGSLKPKDQIVAVAQGTDGEAVDVIDMDLRDVVRKIRGKKDTKVTLSILRKGDKMERLKVTITRDRIDLKEQAASLKWLDIKRGKKKLKIAVIDLPSFYQGTEGSSTEDVKRLLSQAKAEKADGVLLDLSRNGGGLLSAAVEISGLFIERGPVVGVSTGIGTPQVLDDTDPKIVWEGPLVVLTSRLSASASEILAGALQDYGRAVVVGDPQTFGKGTVQQMNPLPPGLGALKVTTALFFLPGGKSTQSVGVASDIVVPSRFAKMEIGEKYQDYAMKPANTPGFVGKKANTSKRWTPVDKKTMETLRKKSVKRVKKSKEFKKLAKETAKDDPNDTRIKIAEILDTKNKKEDDEKKEDEKELSLQAKEAVQVLADLVAR